MKEKHIKKLVIVNDKIMGDVTFIVLTIVLTIVTIVICALHDNPLCYLFALIPIGFMSILYVCFIITVRISKRDEIRIDNKQIVTYKMKEKSVYDWSDVIAVRTEKFNAFSNDGILWSLIELCIRPFYTVMTLSANDSKNNDEISFQISKRKANKLLAYINLDLR